MVSFYVTDNNIWTALVTFWATIAETIEGMQIEKHTALARFFSGDFTLQLKASGAHIKSIFCVQITS